MTTNNQYSLDELASEVISLICDWNSPNHLASDMDSTGLKIARWHQEKLAAINKTIMEDVLECLPSRKRTDNQHEPTRQYLQGYNQALDDVDDQLIKKYGGIDNGQAYALYVFCARYAEEASTGTGCSD